VDPAPGAGTGTLRQAIVDANNNAGADIIQFNLGAAIPYTITLTAALPNLTDNAGVTIDGWENGANDGTPNTVAVFNATAGTPMNATYAVILANGANIATGLVVASNNNVIKGLVMQNFGDGTPNSNDIAVTITGNSNQILGCIIGLDNTGTTRGTKTFYGIYISGNTNSIGDGTAAGANIISGINGNSGDGHGINITGAGATSNSIKGNMIGLQKDGATVVAGSTQQNGINIDGSAASNAIGGTAAGEGNVISGNSNSGILFNSTGASGNTVYGNIIGLRANGTTYVTSNQQVSGVGISNSTNNIIGGNSSAHRNIISGNEDSGVEIGFASGSNIVKGNYVGLDINGTSKISGASQDNGILFLFTSLSNTIGGTGAGEGNVVSGNTYGIRFTNCTASPGASILGNIIGPQANGTSYVTSNAQSHGLYIDGSPDNIIGGNSSGARNVISANENNGFYISGAASTGNVIKGNYIGLDVNGTTFITNSTQDYGVRILSSAASNVIGGTGAGEGNVISGNSNSGIFLQSTAAAGNTVYQNIIGPQADGSTNVASNVQSKGINILDSPNNVIGGNTSSYRNIISANTDYGMFFDGSGATGNTVKGNYIGLRSDGTTILTSGSQDYGVYFTNSSTGNTVGGIVSGEGNLISGNINSGIYTDSDAGNNFYGNIIGLQSDGATIVASNPQTYGIYLSGSPSNTIGGNTVTDVDYRNIISGNDTYGIYITGAASTSNAIMGNYIGLQSNGTTIVTSGSQDYGVYLATSSASTTIGGATAGQGNLISGNSTAGIRINTGSGTGNTIQGNIIGPQADGNTVVASNSQDNGIFIDGGSNNNTIGGNTSAKKNVISANTAEGLNISSNGNTIQGNYIGLASNGTSIITSGNQPYGIYFYGCSTNTVGGDGTAGYGNLIAGNTQRGIDFHAGANTNYIKGNIIGNLQSDGSTLLASGNQTFGIVIHSGSYSNEIGGSGTGERNIISANTAEGIRIQDASSNTNIIKGNIIGLNINGTTIIAGANQQYGVLITLSATNNTIGGTTSGDRNLISGNISLGIYTNSSGGNNVYGNVIGLQTDGATVVASNPQTTGIYIDGSPSNVIGGNTVTDVDYRNIISGNTTYGIYITGASSVTNLIKGNYIGLQSDGATIVASCTQEYGIYITNSAASNTIGGTTSGDGNVISGQSDGAIGLAYGVYINSTAVAGNAIYGNIIGAQANGTTKVASTLQGYGVFLQNSRNNTIGGSTSGHRNIISGNDAAGVYINGASSTGNTVKGNYLGIDINGTTFITGNSQNYGVNIYDNATSNTIGGTAAGEGNVISGNVTAGIRIESNAGANTILGNIIGPQANGTSNVTNNAQGDGVMIHSSPNNVIGGATSSARNIISANTFVGVDILGASATGNLVKGNYIGLDINGTTFIANSSQDYGVYFSSSAGGNTVGGTAAGEGNLISGNVWVGVALETSSVTGNTLYGNIIGPQVDGTTYVSTNQQYYGIYGNDSRNNLIGGSAAGAKNVISGNENFGVYFYGASSTGNSIKGNYIGTDINGTSIISSSSQDYGVYLAIAASNTIGGSAAGEGNVISGNTNSGIYSISTGVAGNTIMGNFIGPQVDGETEMASNAQVYGIQLNDSPNNTIGDNTAGERNIISGNTTYGLYITGASSSGNIIKGNYIGLSDNGASFFVPSNTITRNGIGGSVDVMATNQDYGVYITGSAPNNIIGGTAAGESNIIAYNTSRGVYITGASSNGNKISGSPIYSNVGKPIDLNGSGNNNKSKPIITTWSTTAASGTATAGDVVELFSNQTTDCYDLVSYIGSATADGSGNWNIAYALTTADYISATGRDASNNTSEVSICRLLTLPIELSNFEADCENDKVKINWATATETNNDFFTIERTSDGVSNKKEFIVDSKAINGNSTQVISYIFTDDEPISGTSYYRLKQTDYDGKYEYFDFVSVNCEDDFNEVNIYPNPSNGSFSISGIKLGAEVIIKNVLGQVVASKIITSEKAEFDISSQSKGIYFVNIYFEKKVVSEKVLKN